MLMAAGLGTRLRPFTDLEPKALLPLLGVPMAQFSLDLLASVGVRHVVANIHHLADRTRAGLLSLDRKEMQLSISDESELLLGSAGGIRKALPQLRGSAGGPFFLLNADVLVDADLKGLARRHARLRAQHGVTLTLMVFERAPGTGKYREILFDAEAGLITGLGQLETGRPFFVGAAVLEPEALEQVPGCPAEFVPIILEPAIRAGKAGVFVSSGEWHDVGSPQLWLEAHLSLLRMLETKAPRLWAERIERSNKRIGTQIWVAKKSSRLRGSADWAGPAYWNALEDETAPDPKLLGPRAVLYGGEMPGQIARSGIGFRGIWAPSG
jgi:MurNAc alpha-1-phosphate uridylyltransferase